MATFTASDWLEEYETAANMAASHPHGRRLAELRDSISKLDDQLKVMEASPVKYRVETRELRRRRTLVDKLKKENGVIDTPQVFGGGTFIRPDLPSGGVQRGAGGGSASESVLIHRQIMAEQDVLVSEIGAGVDRLHERALNINEESTLHKNLLDDMDVDVEAATDSLRREAEHANRIRQKSGNCHLYICIAVLFVVLVMLLILGFR